MSAAMRACTRLVWRRLNRPNAIAHMEAERRKLMNETALIIAVIALAISNIASWVVISWHIKINNLDYRDAFGFIKTNMKDIRLIKQYLGEVRVVCLEHKNVAEEAPDDPR